VSISSESPDFVDLLLQYGADPNFRHESRVLPLKSGRLPLAMARETGQVAIVRSLLDYGAKA
jgi:ankyrin repeat protein